MSEKTVTQTPLQILTLPARHQQFIIEDRIMPKREVHILAAASGVGKTTFMVQLIDELIEGNKVFDADTHPIHPVYLCNDRSRDDIMRTFERVRPKHEYPVYSLLTDSEFKGCHTVESYIRIAKALHPETDFMVYDPISFNVENVNSSKEVSALLRRLTCLCQELNITLLIIHHAAKAKTDSFYANPRQKMAGCGAWGGYSNLNMILEEAIESDPTNPKRSLHVCPRNGTNRHYDYILDDAGCFTPAPKKEEDPAKRREKDDQVFNNLPFAEITAADLYEALNEPSNGAMYRSIARWVHSGHMEKTKKRGVYLKIKGIS